MANADSRSINLLEILNVAVTSGAADLHVSVPVCVEEYDAARQVVRVQPMVGSTILEMDGVEVQVAHVALQITTGDHGMLMFKDPRSHPLRDAVFIPDAHPQPPQVKDERR